MGERSGAGHEDIEQAVAGYAFAAVDLGHALFEPCVECRLAEFKPLFFGLEKVESLLDDLGGGAVVAAVEFALDALIGCGIEGDGHAEVYLLGHLKANVDHPAGHCRVGLDIPFSQETLAIQPINLLLNLAHRKMGFNDADPLCNLCICKQLFFDRDKGNSAK
jgi:hypothetical protein